MEEFAEGVDGLAWRRGKRERAMARAAAWAGVSSVGEADSGGSAGGVAEGSVDGAGVEGDSSSLGMEALRLRQDPSLRSG